MGSFPDLIVFRKAFKLAMEIYKKSKMFPKEERYSLTDQVRRSSRSVCANLAEAYRKRIYPKYFISKISAADSEYAETLTWLYFARSCNYISEQELRAFEVKNKEIGKIIGAYDQESIKL